MIEQDDKASKLSITENDDFPAVDFQSWVALAEKPLPDGNTLDDLVRTTIDGLDIHPLYYERSANGKQSNETADAEKPTTSVPPLTPIQHRLRLSGSTNTEKNAQALSGLAGGINSLDIHLAQTSSNETIETSDLSRILERVELSMINVSLQGAHAYATHSDTLQSLWAAQSISKDKAMGSFNADPIATLLQYGYLNNDIEHELKQLGAFSYNISEQFAKCTAVCVNTAIQHNAGASRTQELVAALATATLYMDAMLDAGMAPDAAASTLEFRFSCDADHLLNLVKLRSLRHLWHHVASRFEVSVPQLQLSVETSTRMQSTRTPWINHLRNVNAATSALMSGATALMIHPHNFIDGVRIDQTAEIADRVARNTSIILEKECALHFVHDPMAGSFAVEQLTEQLTNKAWQALQTLEDEGGYLQAVKTGVWQQSVLRSHEKRVQRLIDEKTIAIGVNRYVSKGNNQTSAGTNHMGATATKVSQASIAVDALPARREAAYFEELC